MKKKVKYSVVNMTINKRIVIIGGGVSGCVTALKLSKSKDVVIDIYERRPNILRNLPYCHLHVAGALYPELSIRECEKLFYESLDFAKEFKDFLNLRPTIVAYKSNSSYDPRQLVFKLQLVGHLYAKSRSNLFGDPSEFFRIYTREDMVYFKKYCTLREANIHSKYVENFCKLLKNIDDIKYPFVSVMEPGINQVELENNIMCLLEKAKNINVYTSSSVDDIKKVDGKWLINCKEKYDYLINAMGHDSSKWFPIDEKEFLEYKSSWLIDISQDCFDNRDCIPEMAVIGERGTSDGMIQLTPVGYDKYVTFQVHYMSLKSTIIAMNVMDKLTKGETMKRSTRAKEHIVQTFNIKSSQTRCLNIALDGIQRTVNDSHSKRNSDVIIKENYVEIRLIKATGISRVSDIVVEKVFE